MSQATKSPPPGSKRASNGAAPPRLDRGQRKAPKGSIGPNGDRLADMDQLISRQNVALENLEAQQKTFELATDWLYLAVFFAGLALALQILLIVMRKV